MLFKLTATVIRGVYPPNTLEQVPPPLPLPPPLPSPSPSFPSPPLRSRPPLLRLGGLGERFRSPSGSGWSPAAKWYLVNFRLKISPLVATIFRSFSGKLGGSALIITALPPKLLRFFQKLRGSALIINALPLSFCKKNASPYFFHGAFAPSFIWSRRP